MPVFDKDSSQEVFEQCGTCPEEVRVYIMRKHIAEESRGKVYLDQEKFVKTQGFEVTPLRARALFDSVMILKSRNCPDNRNPFIFARTPDKVVRGRDVHRSAIGAFAPEDGVIVRPDAYGKIIMGVVPCIPDGSSRNIGT